MSSAHHLITCFSTSTGDCSKPPTLGFITEARKSSIAACGVPVPITHPQKRGWMLPLGYGRTSERNSSYTASSPMPARGSGSDVSASRTSAGIGFQVGRSRTSRR